MLEQDHFKYDEYPVMDVVIMGNARLYEIMKELLYKQLAGLIPKVIVACIKLDFAVINIRDLRTYFILQAN